MEHLSVDEIMDFVSFTKIDEESLALAAKVTGHICECAQCRESVRSFQLIYDEFVKLCIDGDFRKYVAGKGISR